MPSFFRRSIQALVASGAILSSWAAMGVDVLALTEAQIVEQLDAIPVFTITNTRGVPYVTEIRSQEEDTNPTIITKVFISLEDAETSLNVLREEAPELGNEAQVTPVSLANIYKLALEGREDANPLEFLFVPIVEEVEYAMSILPNASNSESAGVPLFMVSAPEAPEGTADADEASDTNEEGEKVSLLTLQQGEEEVVPLFFRRDQFDGIVNSIQEEQPDFAANLELRVIWLEDFIGILERADNDDEDIQQYQMIPLPESIEFARNFLFPTQEEE